jgi:tetratricopeptide (TPR) repeat protein
LSIFLEAPQGFPRTTARSRNRSDESARRFQAYPKLATRLQRADVMMREERTLRSRLPLVAACTLSVAFAALPAHAERLMFARDGSGSSLAREAVALCLDAAKVENDTQRADMLQRGLDTAERAVAENANDAKAHFAVFCSLGRQLEDDGATLAGVANVSRLKSEIDRALSLEPGFVDALTAKGSFLVKLPGLLGGDDDEGELLLRRAVQLAPKHAPARLELAKALDEKGDRNAALEEARAVLTLADARSAIEAREARELTAKLGS